MKLIKAVFDLPHESEDRDPVKIGDVHITFQEDGEADRIELRTVDGFTLYSAALEAWAWQQFALEPWTLVDPRSRTVEYFPDGKIVWTGYQAPPPAAAPAEAGDMGSSDGLGA